MISLGLYVILFYVLDTSYRVGDRMVISFDFRTHKSEGLILSLSNGESGPALTVELYNGRVRLGYS